MSRQSGPAARGYLKIRPTGSTTRVLSNCRTDLVGWLRVWVYIRHLEKRGSRGNLLACPSPPTGDINVTYVSVFFPQASLHPDQPESRMKPQVPFVFMCVCLPLICVVGQICSFIHMYCTHTFLHVHLHHIVHTGNTFQPCH